MIAHASLAGHLVTLVAAVGAVAAYGWAWWRGDVGPGRLAAWALGVLALTGATSPPVEALAARSFTGHMVQHLAMIVVAAPLLVVARPLDTARRARTRRGHRPGAIERRTAHTWRRAGTVVAPLGFAVVLVGTHLTGVYDAALRHRWVHELEHVAYAVSAVALWGAIRAGGTRRAVGRVGAVFGVIACTAFVGVVLISATTPLVPTYAALLGTGPALADQRHAAALMWVTGMLTTLPLLLLAVWRWAETEERTARRAEALVDAGRSGAVSQGSGPRRRPAPSAPTSGRAAAARVSGPAP